MTSRLTSTEATILDRVNFTVVCRSFALTFIKGGKDKNF